MTESDQEPDPRSEHEPGQGSYQDPESDQEPDPERIDLRAELLPEEQQAGSEDPRAQAEAILAESDDRTDHPARTQRESTQTPD